MPKSRNRKNHKKKVKQFQNKIQQQKNAYKKAYLEMMNTKQEELIKQQVQQQKESEIVNIDDINSDELKID
jgi:hypothetical protein